MTILSSRFPGSSEAHELSSKTIPGRYLVVSTQVDDVTYLIHDVYAPCVSHEKTAFYAALASNSYLEGARHLLLRDVNFPHNVSLDSNAGEPRDSGARTCFNLWLASIGVGEAWRRHHPSDRVFNGPEFQG